MRNYFTGKNLGLRRQSPTRVAGFTLAELVIAIGILVLMLSLASQVFNVTVQSTGQATALTKLNQLIRAFERTLREDLKHVRPGQSLLLVQGNPVNAYWTQRGKEADLDGDPANGYPHASDPAREASGKMVSPRADVLMFVTTRGTTSFVHPDVSSELQQVVYGHTTLGEYAPGKTGAYEFFPNQPADKEAFPFDERRRNYPSPAKASPVPAESWHLGRRGVLLVSSAPPLSGGGSSTGPWIDANPAKEKDRPDAYGLGAQEVLRSETDIVGNFDYEGLVLTPGKQLFWYLPKIFDHAMEADRIGGLRIPYARSDLDLTPPAPLADRLGHFFVPNCASFKVEWALDPHSEFVAGRLDGAREVYWFDPGDAKNPLRSLMTAATAASGALKNNLESLIRDRTRHPDGLVYSLADRFGGPQLREDPYFGPYYDAEYAWAPLAADDRPNLVVFGAQRWNLGTSVGPEDDELAAEDVFPAALRITMDVLDGERRLDRPVRHVMVVPLGG